MVRSAPLSRLLLKVVPLLPVALVTSALNTMEFGPAKTPAALLASVSDLEVISGPP